MTFYCKDCEKFFEDYEVETRWGDTWADGPGYEGRKVNCCPYCNGGYEQASECVSCGQPTPPGETLCKDCDEELYKIVEGAVKKIAHDSYLDENDAVMKFSNGLDTHFLIEKILNGICEDKDMAHSVLTEHMERRWY